LKDQIADLKKSTDEAKAIAENFEYQKGVSTEIKALESKEVEISSK
jgi:hypothetical protein